MISIVIPSYNSELTLEKCVNSALNQTYHDVEVIIVDDGSTDSSPKICDEFKEKDPRVKVLHKENEGCANARIDGVNLASGKWLLFIDSDDFVEANLCEECLKIVDNHEVDAVRYTFNDVFPKSTIKSNLNYDQVILDSKDIVYSLSDTGLYPFIGNKIEIGNFITLLFMKRVVFKDSIKTMPVTFTEDALFLIRFLMRANKIYLLNKAFYNYFHNETSVTNQYMRNYFDTIILTKELCREEVKTIRQYDEFEINYDYVKTVAKAIENECRPTNKLTFKEKYKVIQELVNIKQVRAFYKKSTIPKEISRYFKVSYRLIKYKQIVLLILLNKYIHTRKK